MYVFIFIYFISQAARTGDISDLFCDHPAVSPNIESKKDRLQEEFRTVLSLTALTATVNNQGRPILAQQSAPYRSFDEAHGENHLVLNAITTLLVRKSEAIAGVACKPPPPASLECEPNHYEVLVIQNADPVACLKPEAEDKGFGGASNSEGGETFQQLGGGLMLTNVTAVANPDSHRYISHGQSHMARIRDHSNYWERCFQIP